MKFKYILGFAFVVMLSVVYYEFNPEMYNFFPECPFHKFLHLDCPGCGSQRAIHSLLHGNIIQALNYNLLLVISLPFLLLHLLLKIFSYLCSEDYNLKIWHKPITPKIIFVVVVIFWISRNIPKEPFIYLAA
ncbi:DUF2752 domain-containing protein [Pedobacter frigidisoli]|uniref:DUF2752 domain-containing protein n=1 Tax=Pedobacter frigidisoli TaxID=2530455 RepID=A0A4R0P7R2_9SPHI|nr:DUF2752 domain-containing protein [Pedobacter frigidisoli]TCD12795.1 DUF2752 domain-containing protein [Pedobacter frigidisoli]